MNEGTPRNRPRKEPIRKPWIWVILVVLILAGIPWYLPPGTLHPLVLGLPYWFMISIVGTVALCAYLSWLCLTQWDMVEEEEESGGSAAIQNSSTDEG